jgi:hypothetical protein
VLGAYAVPAAALWAVLGLAIALLVDVALGSVPLGTGALLLAIGYCAGYGAIELYGLPWPAPGRRWQVPQEMMIGAGGRRRVLVWGSILGPGFLTRNPFAGFGVLPVLLAAIAGAPGHSVTRLVSVAALIGAAHGSGRALALLRDIGYPQDEPFALLLRSLRWRLIDGLALLALAGAAIVTAGRLLG